MGKLMGLKMRTGFLVVVVILLVGITADSSWKESSGTGLQAAENPLVIQGRRLYTQFHCEYCHRLKGRGGTVGPALDNVGFRRTTEWLSDHFQNPQKLSKGSQMARIPLKDDQVKALTAFMNSLGGRTFTPEAPTLFVQYCSSCHRMNDIGVPTTVDLSNEGQFRDIDFIQNRIKDPLQMKPTTTMPSFGRVLTDAQIKDLAVYIFRGGR